MSPQPALSGSPKRPWGCIIGLGVAMIVVAVFLAWLLLGSSGNSTPTSNTARPGASALATSSSPSPTDAPSQTATPSPTDSVSDSATPTATPTTTASATKAPQPTGPKSTVSFTLSTSNGTFQVSIVRQPLQHYVPGTDFGAAALASCQYTPSNDDVVVPMTITMTNVSGKAYSPGLGAARLIQYDPSDWEDSFLLAVTTNASPASGCPQYGDRSDKYTLGYLSAKQLASGESESFSGYLIVKGGYANPKFGAMSGDTRLSFGLIDANGVSGIHGIAQAAPPQALTGVSVGMSPTDYAPSAG